MMQNKLTRRRWLQSGILPTTALAGLGLTRFCPQAVAQTTAKPSSLTITKVETFPLRHRMRRAMGVSTSLSNTRTCLLIKISTDSGLVGWGETIDVGGTR